MNSVLTSVRARSVSADCRRALADRCDQLVVALSHDVTDDRRLDSPARHLELERLVVEPRPVEVCPLVHHFREFNGEREHEVILSNIRSIVNPEPGRAKETLAGATAGAQPPSADRPARIGHES